MQTATKPQPELSLAPIGEEATLRDTASDASREWQAKQLRLLWSRRRLFVRTVAISFAVSALIAFLIPKSYTSTALLMPPDTQSSMGMALMGALTAKGVQGLGGVAGDLLGLKSSGALFVGVLRSQTSQDQLVERFALKRAYGKRLGSDARMKLDENTSISEDRKSGIISISVVDHSPQRAAALANAYVDELNSLVSALSTSSARRERVFLEERLKAVKQDLDTATNQLAQFSSKNNTLDIQQEGRAMLDAAGMIAGQLIAAQSQLEGLRQIYTENNPRVKSLSAHVMELRRQLQKLSGTTEKGDIAAKQNDQPAAKPLEGLPYPTIRSLPILGAKYGDYYRRAKIQETIYELLTEQYEIAKVQEAKEIPSVKVLDPGTVPERKSSPPRLMIVVLGTLSALACSICCVMGSAQWRELNPSDPRKVLVNEVAGDLMSRAPWLSKNGNCPVQEAEGNLAGLDRPHQSSNGEGR